MDVEQHGPGRVGIVGHVGFATGQVPDEPGIDRAEQQVALLRLFPRAGHVLQDPADLRAGEIRVDLQAGLGADLILPLRLQALAVVRRSAALPDDGVVYGQSRILIPDDRRLSLVRDADGRDLLRLGAGFQDRFLRHAQLGRPDLHRVMLHPARMGIDLFEFLLRDRHLIAFAVKDDAAVACGARIQGHDVFRH